MLLPLNLKTSKSVALSIIKINQFYSIKPCTIVNGFGMDEIDSSFILTKAENENYFHIDKSYKFTSIKDMKNIINKIKDIFICI